MKQQEGGRGDLPPPLQHRRRGGEGGPPPLGFEHISSPGEEGGGYPVRSTLGGYIASQEAMDQY